MLRLWRKLCRPFEKKLDYSEEIQKKCNIHREDGTPFEFNIVAKTTAGTIIKDLSSELPLNQDWVVVLELDAFHMERRLEDDEKILPVYLYWKQFEVPEDLRFRIRRSSWKFKYLTKAKEIFPPKMFAIDDEDFQNPDQKSDIARETQLQYMILRSGNVPIVFEQLQIMIYGKNDAWETKFVALQNDALFCSPSLTTDTSKMEKLLNLKECDVHLLKKPPLNTDLESRSEHFLCINKFEVKKDDNYTYPSWVMMACGSKESKFCWLTAFRMAKFGRSIRSGYYESNAKRKYLVHRLPSMSERTRIAIEFSDKVNVQHRIGPDKWVARSDVQESSNLGHLLEMPFFDPEVTKHDAHRLLLLHPEVNGAYVIYGNRDEKKPYILLYRVYKPDIPSETHSASILKFKAKIMELKTEESKTEPNRNEKDFHFYYKISTKNDDSPPFRDLLQLVEYYGLNDGLLSRLTHYIDKDGKLHTLDLKTT